MNWQATYLIESEVPIEKGRYICEGEEIIVFEIVNSPTEELRVLRATNENFPCTEIVDAHLFLEEIVKIFLAKVSVVGYCKTSVKQHFSTTLKVAKYQTSFEILVANVLMHRKHKEKIAPQDLEYSISNLDEVKRFYFQNIAKALQTTSLEEKILFLFTAIEKYASSVTEQDVMNKCPSCSHTWTSGRKATNNAIKELLREGGVSKEMSEKFVKSRQWIAHSSKIKTARYFSELKEILLAVQHIFYELSKKIYEIDFVNTEMPITDHSYAVYDAVYNDRGMLTIHPKRFAGNLGISTLLKEHENVKRNLEFSYGLYVGEDIKRSIPIDDEEKISLYLPSIFEY